jgi:hypothetical protein
VTDAYQKAKDSYEKAKDFAQDPFGEVRDTVSAVGTEIKEMGQSIVATIKALFLIPFQVIEYVLGAVIDWLPEIMIITAAAIVIYVLWKRATGVNLAAELVDQGKQNAAFIRARASQAQTQAGQMGQTYAEGQYEVAKGLGQAAPDIARLAATGGVPTPGMG